MAHEGRHVMRGATLTPPPPPPPHTHTHKHTAEPCTHAHTRFPLDLGPLTLLQHVLLLRQHVVGLLKGLEGQGQGPRGGGGRSGAAQWSFEGSGRAGSREEGGGQVRVLIQLDP